MDFKITVYNADYFGYYKRNESEPSFGTLKSIIEDLTDWASNKTLIDTKTWESDGEDTLNCYCFDIIKSTQTGNYLVVTWNEVPSEDGNIQSVNPNGKVGELSVNMTELTEGYIPGYPSYFYIIPEEKIIFSVRPKDMSHSGKQGFEKYLKNYTTFFSKYCVFDTEKKAVIKYAIPSECEETDQKEKLIPRVRITPKRIKDDIEKLTERVGEIRKLIRSNKFTNTHQEDSENSIWDRIFGIFGLPASAMVEESDSTYKIEIPVSLGKEDLNHIIDDYYHSDSPDLRVGFKIKGEQSPIWLDGMYAKDEITLNVNKDKSGIINSRALIKNIDANLNTFRNIYSKNE